MSEWLPELYVSGQYDFFTCRGADQSWTCPVAAVIRDPRAANPKTTFPVGQPSAVTIMEELELHLGRRRHQFRVARH